MCWLAKARRKDDHIQIEVPDKGSEHKLPWGSHGICSRECYGKFERVVMESWPLDHERCCVVTGTPGIGKSTLLYYFLWKFMHEGLKDYQTVVYGDKRCIFYMQQDSTAGRWRIHRFDTKRGHEFTGRSLGLIDAPADCNLPGLTLNDQNIVTTLCVHHLLITASAGLLLTHSDLRKATLQTYVLPAWQPEALRSWCCDRCGLPEEQWEARVRLCGDEVPRLVLGTKVLEPQQDWLEKFESTLKGFLGALLGITPQGLSAAPREDHTLLILQPSHKLAEEPGEEAGPTAGTMLRYVSVHVQREVHCTMLINDLLPGFLAAIPQAAPFAFEELVLRRLTEVGLEIEGGTLKMDAESWLEDLLSARSEPKLNVLYRPRSRHYTSIDAYAVRMNGLVRTAYLIQVTTAMKHSKVQLRHVEKLPFAGAAIIVCLYIVPAQRYLKLPSGDGPLLPSSGLVSGGCREEIASAEAVLGRFPPHIKDIFLGDAAGVAQMAAKRQRT